MNNADIKTLFNGVLHDGIEASKLSCEARKEIVRALDKLLELSGEQPSQKSPDK